MDRHIRQFGDDVNFNVEFRYGGGGALVSGLSPTITISDPDDVAVATGTVTITESGNAAVYKVEIPAVLLTKEGLYSCVVDPGDTAIPPYPCEIDYGGMWDNV
jgi:hypothetical protein